MQGGAISWQNVQFVKKVFIMEIMSAILIEDQIMFWKSNIKKVSCKVNGVPQKLYVCTSCLRSGKVERALVFIFESFEF